MIVLVVLSMLDIRIQSKSNETATVFVLDVSDSVADQKSAVVSYMKEILSKKTKKDQVGIVTFAKNTEVEQVVTDEVMFQEIETTPVKTATNLQQAIETAMALYPSDMARRLVLVTDGNENEGDITKVTSTLTESQVDVKVLKLSQNIGKEVYLDQMILPEKVAKDGKFSVKIQVQSNTKTTAVISLYSGNQLKKKETVELVKGENQFVLKDQQSQVGLKTYRAVIEPKEDTISVNNEYVAFTNVTAKDTVLLLEGTLGNSKEFQKILKAGNIAYEVQAAGNAPKTMLNMLSYQAIVCVDVYAGDLPEGFLNNLESYVKDYGGGFLATGGENSFALGDYKDTSLEKVLPVTMDLKGEKEIPKMALGMAIDHSGSMSFGEGENGLLSPLSLAKEAAIKALDTLRVNDIIGVLAFSDSYDWAVTFQEAANKDELEDGIDSIGNGGGTSIYPALKELYEKIQKEDAKLKHMILLSDGQDGFQEYDDLLEKINQEKITLSTVAVGSESDTALMKKLAKEGNGRYYYTDINTDLPRIFAKEVYLTTKSYLNQREFVPIVKNEAEIFQGVSTEKMPTMLGYIASTKKASATMLLESDKNDPILTSWQYGLGRSVAFNSDVENRWTAEYAGWKDYAALWKNIFQWVMKKQDTSENVVQVTESGNQVTVNYRAKEYTENTEVQALYTDKEGNTKNVILNAVAPGEFQAKWEMDEMGVYTFNVQQKENNQTITSQNSAIAIEYSKEYKVLEEKSVLEDFIKATQGTEITQDTNIFKETLEKVNKGKSITPYLLVTVLLLFFFDILYRRLDISLEGLFKKELKNNKKEEKELQEGKGNLVQKPKKEKDLGQPKVKRKKVKKQKTKAERLNTSELLSKKKDRE